MDCLNEINFGVDLFSRMLILNFLVWINLSEMNLHFALNFVTLWPHKVAWSKSHTLPPCQVWLYSPCKKGDIEFSIWHVTSCDHVIRFVQLHYGLPPTTCQHPAKFSGHKSSGGRNIPFVVCHMTLVTRWSEGHMTWWVRLPHRKPSTCQVS